MLIDHVLLKCPVISVETFKLTGDFSTIFLFDLDMIVGSMYSEQ